MIAEKKTTMKIAELKAHLSQAVKAVKNGETITIHERDTPVAKLVPIEEKPIARVRHPANKFKAIHSTLDIDFDVQEGLKFERGRR